MELRLSRRDGCSWILNSGFNSRQYAKKGVVHFNGLAAQKSQRDLRMSDKRLRCMRFPSIAESIGAQVPRERIPRFHCPIRESEDVTINFLTEFCFRDVNHLPGLDHISLILCA